MELRGNYHFYQMSYVHNFNQHNKVNKSTDCNGLTLNSDWIFILRIMVTIMRRYRDVHLWWWFRDSSLQDSVYLFDFQINNITIHDSCTFPCMIQGVFSEQQAIASNIQTKWLRVFWRFEYSDEWEWEPTKEPIWEKKWKLEARHDGD